MKKDYRKLFGALVVCALVASLGGGSFASGDEAQSKKGVASGEDSKSLDSEKKEEKIDGAPGASGKEPSLESGKEGSDSKIEDQKDKKKSSKGGKKAKKANRSKRAGKSRSRHHASAQSCGCSDANESNQNGIYKQIAPGSSCEAMSGVPSNCSATKPAAEEKAALPEEKKQSKDGEASPKEKPADSEKK
ncbi:hypothetical protein [Candidatus Hydrogenosomobacter endosymbioticus]|uniref:Uncharacterized protein n=1 Tax=Candidatus Hydrogenosomobacter endosymbioticus TaxID=2558174 RepID=A0ABM7V946_9PROT|nr:hypothetical protein [Candidatus Hydrogenosomobacter endosymbioticus]BDB96320.1 hypothetical protein HYD_4530 [Candidatus Hydrogenosomobacter endosymbioticus]